MLIKHMKSLRLYNDLVYLFSQRANLNIHPNMKNNIGQLGLMVYDAALNNI